MGILDLFRRKAETRSSGMGYTAQVMAARASYIAGTSDLGELTSTVQSCISLWEGALAGADVDGTDLLDRRTMALVARSLALRGEFVTLIRDRLVPAADWDLSTRNGTPRAYRLSVSEAGGGRAETVLAGEVLHVRIGSDPVAPWHGTPPLRRAALSANLLHALESALRDTWRDAPIGSQVLPLPDSSPEDMAAMRSAIRGKHGSTLIVEGVAQATAAGMNPQIGQRREDLTPDLHRAEAATQLEAAKGAISQAFGVLPALHNPSATGPVIREAQRHLAQWTLEPLVKLIAEEASEKLGGAVTIDVVRPLQAYDAGGKARAFSAMVGALIQAKEAALDVAPVLHRLDND
jgi:phage portal protein BeeE